MVVDTPGLYDTRHGNEITAVELTKCVYLSAPGPHAIILVIRGGERQTEQVQKCAEFIMDVFGNQARKYMIVLFTGRDNLEYHKKPLSQYMTTLPDKMKELIAACGNRYLAFNNRCMIPKDNISQVKELLKLIDVMVAQNGGCCFTNDVYKEFERRINEKELEMRIHLEKKKEEELNKVWNQAEKEKREKLELLNMKISEDQKKQNQLAADNRLLQKKLERSEENEKRMIAKQQEEKQKRMDLEQRRMEAEINEKVNKKIRDQEDKFNEQIAKVREDVRKEVESDEPGTGDLIFGGLKNFAIGVGQAVVKGAAKFVNLVFG